MLAELATQIEQLRGRLDEELDPAETADLLEQITQLAQQALDEIERRAEGFETTEPAP